MARILIIDDEEPIRFSLRGILEDEGYEVLEAATAEEGLEVADAERPDLVFLDIWLPGMDGLQVLKEIRKTSKVPVIMLTARDETFDKVLGLELGADDYVTKPFNPLELTARVKSQIRRYVRLGSLEVRENQLVTGGLVLDTDTKEVTVDGDPVRLTAREYKILEYLMHNIGRVLSSAQIYEAVWNEPAYGTEKTVTVHIRNIREKIEINPKEPKYLKVVYGLGYKVEKC